MRFLKTIGILIFVAFLTIVVLRIAIKAYYYKFDPAYTIYEIPTTYNECVEVNTQKKLNTGEEVEEYQNECRYIASLDMFNPSIPYEVQEKNYANCIAAGGEKQTTAVFAYALDYCRIIFPKNEGIEEESSVTLDSDF